MTVTVKLDPLLEEQLRRRAAADGTTASDVIRQSLIAYFKAAVCAEPASAFDLGADLFGRHRAEPELAASRKSLLADAWANKHRARR